LKVREAKIVGVGFQKTGTSTLREALKILGFKVGDTRYKLLLPILRRSWKTVFTELDRYDAVEDNPWPLIFEEIDNNYPNSKFILTERDSESWFASVSKHIGTLRDPMHEWIYGRNNGIPKDNKSNTIKVYNDHCDKVKSYFKDRPQDLLIIDFKSGDQWAKLCQFLDCEIPDAPFPHENKANYSKKANKSFPRSLKIFKKRIKYYLQIKYIDFLGLWN
jgi:hypothetical protein